MALTTLRETLTQEFDKAEEAVAPASPAPPAEEGDRSPAPEAAVAGEPEKPAGRTAGRARDEHGRLLPGKPVKPEAAPAVTPAPTPAVEAKPRPPRPSSWKKEYWDHWEKLDPTLAEYLGQRESEFAKGVSTYKSEYDRLKPLDNAMQEFMPLLQQHGIEPTQWITNLGNAHRTLALGNAQQKLQMFAQLARDYQVPLQHLFFQGQDGRMYPNQQLMQLMQQPRPQAPQPDVTRIVEQKLAEVSANEQTRSFIAAKDAQGNPAHPHYETVRETMAQLLESGLADDLDGAYEAALRHPRHSDIFDAIQQQKREHDEAEKQRRLKEEAARAKANLVSPKSSTPAGAPAGAKKGLRAQLEEATDQVLGGRV